MYTILIGYRQWPFNNLVLRPFFASADKSAIVDELAAILGGVIRERDLDTVLHTDAQNRTYKIGAAYGLGTMRMRIIYQFLS